MQLHVIIESAGGRETREIRFDRVLNLGSALRDDERAAQHRAEMREIGIEIASDVPAPRIYPLGDWAVTTGQRITVQGERTSGEVEPVVLVDDGQLYVGLGSDHTDRELETAGIPWSKQVCPNVLSPVLWPYEEVRDRWDDAVLRSWADGELYQEVEAGAFLTPEDMVRIVGERVEMPSERTLIFGGTYVSVGAEVRYATRWDLELALPDGPAIRHRYEVDNVLQEIKEPWRVPLTSSRWQALR
jgi:hypothetical protein